MDRHNVCPTGHITLTVFIVSGGNDGSVGPQANSMVGSCMDRHYVSPMGGGMVSGGNDCSIGF